MHWATMKSGIRHFEKREAGGGDAQRAGFAGAILSGMCAAEVASAATVSGLDVISVRDKNGRGPAVSYLEVTTDIGVSGYGGPLLGVQVGCLKGLKARLRELLVGSDPRSRVLDFEWIWGQLYPGASLRGYENGVAPLTDESIWNTRRAQRHTPTGSVVAALSAVDNALWDIRGRLANQPVYRLLGGNRQSLRAYISTVPGEDIDQACRDARRLFDEGHTAQKWFFRWGPPDGREGFRKIVGLVEGLRNDLGENAELMFDFHVGSRGRCDWDVDYAIRVARAIQPFSPKWLEEPFSPEEIDSYRRLKGETGIALACGEHTYSRWNIKPFLDQGLVQFVQSDPEWCGGVSELLHICRLADRWEDVRVIPHGHHVLAAAHVVASQPESLCPMVEHGPGWLRNRQRVQTCSISPRAGSLPTPDEPGLGPPIDWDRCERVLCDLSL